MNSRTVNAYVSMSEIVRAGDAFGPAFDEDKETLKQLIKLESDLERALIKYFNGLAKERMDSYINWNEFRTRSRKAADVVDPIGSAGWKQEAKLFKQAVYDALYLGTVNGINAGVSIYSLPMLQDNITQIAQKTAKKHVATLIKNTNRTSRNMIKNSLLQSIELGETVEEASKRVAKIIKDPNRATTIARTESVNSYGNGLLEFGVESGATHKEWQAVLDNNTSPICLELDGQVVKINEPFVYAGEEIDSPGAHVNCRSSMVLIFDGDE